MCEHVGEKDPIPVKAPFSSQTERSPKRKGFKFRERESVTSLSMRTHLQHTKLIKAFLDKEERMSQTVRL